MITIEDSRFRVGINKHGAELCSFYDKLEEREIIWQADPSVWGGSAPILFPIVGKLCGGQTRINDRVYKIPEHGLVRRKTAMLVHHGTDQVTFAFESDTKTLTQYPFPFVLEVKFRLRGEELEVLYCVKNLGKEEMLFMIGSHPAFALDLECARLEDYSVEFEDAAGVKQVQLSESLFSGGAVIFSDIRPGIVCLKSSLKARDLKIEIRDAQYLTLWSRPGAAFVCVEPWSSYDDPSCSDGRLENNPDILRLSGGSVLNTGYTIRVMG
ncbi:aldose 1-epimerase family protein [Pontiellaceae bacterium B1224]|nr:aldose 1-epimerase family protein [Pontiellaceae bacterium B1224]